MPEPATEPLSVTRPPLHPGGRRSGKREDEFRVSDRLVDGDLVLRRRVAADAADIAEVYNEADIQHWMLWEAEEIDEAEALANIRRSEEAWEEGSNAPFRIVVDGHVVGGVNLSSRGFDVAEVAYFLRASARGRGLATRAVLLAVDWGFRERRLARIQLRADPHNLPSTALAVRAGFTYEGTERSSAAYPDGRRIDSLVYSMLPAERVAVRPAPPADAEFLTDTAIAAARDQGRLPVGVDLAAYRARFLDRT